MDQAFTKLDGALDVLLELADSQITYRLRYVVVGAAPASGDRSRGARSSPSPRSVAYQLGRIEAHLSALPPRSDDGRLQPPRADRDLARDAVPYRPMPRRSTWRHSARTESALMKFAEVITSTYFTTHERAEVRWEALG